MAPIAYFFLPDTPDKARFLTEEERVGKRLLFKDTIDVDTLKLIAKARGVRQVGSVERIGGTLGFRSILFLNCTVFRVMRHIKEAICSPDVSHS